MSTLAEVNKLIDKDVLKQSDHVSFPKDTKRSLVTSKLTPIDHEQLKSPPSETTDSAKPGVIINNDYSQINVNQQIEIKKYYTEKPKKKKKKAKKIKSVNIQKEIYGIAETYLASGHSSAVAGKHKK